MSLSKQQLWARFQKYYSQYPTLGLTLDLSRMNFPENFFASMEPQIQRAFDAMDQLEHGAIANPDEHRMVGHYWLRNPALAPTEAIRQEIETTLQQVETFADKIHRGAICGSGGPFKNLLLIGIGGSALGPQFVSHALSNPTADKLKLYTFDNTDPDGMDRVLAEIGPELSRTLCVVISKSGGTKETRNGMLEAKAAYERAGLVFGTHAVAVTQKGSELSKTATQQKWIDQFPMWDWVGGRTSELSAVGLLPAALQRFDIRSLLAGAKACDEITRMHNVKANPAAQLALMWYYSGNGKGERNLIFLPYKDRLELFSKYLQQLIMESLGKERDQNGRVVNQGICVFGNKGSTDQHSYIQQLREGLNNFVVTFIEVLEERKGPLLEVEPGITSGDYLQGFLLGTRQALFENGRESMMLTIRSVNEFSIGVLIALFERVVGFYASLLQINAYHQPGVEAGKKAAAAIIALQLKVLDQLSKHEGRTWTVSELADSLHLSEESETIFHICEQLAVHPSRHIEKVPASEPAHCGYRKV